MYTDSNVIKYPNCKLLITEMNITTITEESGGVVAV